MFAETLTLNFAGTGDLVLTRRKEGNYSSEYSGTIGTQDFILTVKHTIPPNRQGGEHSHLVRLDVITYDASNVIIGRASAWRVFGSYIGQQVTATVTNLDKALTSLMTAGNMTKLLNGES